MNFVQKINLAILEPEPGLIEVYRDAFAPLPIEIDSYNETEINNFLSLRYKYQIVIIAHRLGKRSWASVYKKIPNDVLVIVTATFPHEYYKQEFPKEYSDLNSEQYPAILFCLKEKTKKLFRIIEMQCLEINSILLARTLQKA